MITKKIRWTSEEEGKAKELLLKGSTCREVSKIMNRSLGSIANKNRREWHVDLKDIDYNEKLSRTVKASADKISAFQKKRGRWAGKNNPNYGSKIVKKGKDNPLSVWKKNNPGYQDGDRNPSYGRIPSKDEIKRKTAKLNELAKKRIGKTNEELYGKDIADKMSMAVRRSAVKRISMQKSSGTRPELKMIEILKSLNLEFEFQKDMGYYCVDFFLPTKNLIIQVDGCYWHGCPVHFSSLDRRQRDRRRLDNSCDSFLRNKGYKVLRVWECEFIDIENIKSKVKKEEELCVLSDLTSAPVSLLVQLKM